MGKIRTRYVYKTKFVKTGNKPQAAGEKKHVLTERVPTGVPGLDELMQGGFLRGSANLIAGSTGTCKTLFCCQYIWQGLKKGENVVYITLEEPANEIISEARELGMDFAPYIKDKKCVIEYIFPKSIDEIDYEIFNRIKGTNATRFVLDGLALIAFASKVNDQVELRAKIFEIVMRLKQYGVTSLIVGEIPENSKGLSRFGFEEFIVDTVIVLHYMEYTAGGTPRSIVIRKMRRTNHGTDIYPFEITKQGIVVKKS